MIRTQTRTAAFFHNIVKAANAASRVQRDLKAHTEFIAKEVENKEALDAVYAKIEASAKQGGIRIFLERNDPVFKNGFVMWYLTSHGFSVTENTIEWWQAKGKDEELK